MWLIDDGNPTKTNTLVNKKDTIIKKIILFKKKLF